MAPQVCKHYRPETQLQPQPVVAVVSEPISHLLKLLCPILRTVLIVIVLVLKEVQSLFKVRVRDT